MTSEAIIPAERVARAILVIRGQKVILDDDLAALYGVETRILVRNFKRHPDRFPSDFAFQLLAEEWAALRSQFGISNARGGRRHAPHAFTEHGALMAASILNSPGAVQVGLQVVRAFVQLRELLAMNADLARRVARLERSVVAGQTSLRALSDAFRESSRVPPRTSRRRIGFEAAPDTPIAPDDATRPPETGRLRRRVRRG